MEEDEKRRKAGTFYPPNTSIYTKRNTCYNICFVSGGMMAELPHNAETIRSPIPESE
jgi:hypothetical protein